MFKERGITIITDEDRHTRDFGWLRTSWLFSFGDYQDRDNRAFGPLRVFNDDLVQPGEGFTDHRHEDVEIITFVLDGEITYRDSAGNNGITSRDQARLLSAGTGVIHSEFNSGDVPVHVYEMWFLPNVRGMAPSYAQGTFPAQDRKDKLQVLASGEGKGGLEMASDATLYACDLGKGGEVSLGGGGRLLLIYLIDGSAVVEGRDIGPNYQVRMRGPTTVRSERGAKMIIIDMQDLGPGQ